MTVRTLLRGVPVVAVVVVAAVAAAIRGDFKDLLVYQHAGQSVLDGVSVYASDDPVTGLPFTYPPFAAVLMVPLAPLPAWLAAALWTGASMLALSAVIVLVLRALGRPAPGWLVALLTAGALALEPVWQNLTFGQVNLVLMLAVLVDLLRPERRWSGVLVGLVAGVKLAPLVLVVMLVLVGRRAAAGRAILTFAGTVVVGFVVMPGPAKAYWTDDLVRASRVGPPELAHNQSVYGALARLLGEPALDAALAGRRRAARRGRPARGRSVVAARRPGAGHLPGSAGHAGRVAGLLVTPLGVGGAAHAGPVAAQPLGGRGMGRGVRGAPDPVAAVG